MANIFREVDEDIRKERYINLFRKYGVYVIAIIVIIVGTLAGIQFYSGYQVCLLYTSPSPRDVEESRMPSSA